MKWFQIFWVLVFTIVCGCSEQKFKAAASESIEDIPIDDQKPRPACEISEIDYQFKTQVVEFAATSTIGLHFGFSLIPNFEWLSAFEARFRLKKSRLTISTSLAEYLKPLQPLGQETGIGQRNETYFGADVDMHDISGGGSWESATPFFTVMMAALKDSVKKTVKHLNQIQTPWNTVIVKKLNDGQFIIPAGKNAGIQVGDQFEVYNMEHVWAGEPCASDHRMAAPTTESALALVEIKSEKDLTPNAARVHVKQKFSDANIELGAFLYIHKIKSKLPLKRSLSIDAISPFLLHLKDKNQNRELDLTPYLKTALGPVLREQGFYIKSFEESKGILSWDDNEAE